MTTVDEEIGPPGSGFRSAHLDATVQRSLHENADNVQTDAIRRVGVWLAGVAIVMLYLLHARWLGYFGDDAYISFQYVKNFLHGHGLVYNVGERVEGYTDFLWVMLLSVVIAVFRNADIAAASVVLGLGFGVLSMALVVVMARRLHPGRRWLVLVAPLLMACQTSYCAWSTGGLESTMFGFFVLVAIYAQDRELRNASGTAFTAVAAVLIALTRADGFVVVGALGLWRLYETWRSHGSIIGRRQLEWAAIVVGGIATHALWRHWYYGEWLPNTSYAKVGFTVSQLLRGYWYVRTFSDDSGGPWLLVAIGVPWIRRMQAPVLRGALTVTLVWTAYVAFVGGDGLTFFRFFAYIVPVLSLLAQEGVIALADWRDADLAGVSSRRANAAVAIGTMLLAVTGAYETIDLYRNPLEAALPYRNGDNMFLAKCRVAAEWLAAHSAPDAVIASNPAGAIAYFSDRRVIDMLGLNDHHIARVPVAEMGVGRAGHEKGDGAYVLGRQPDYILMGNVFVGRQPVVTPDEMKQHLRLRSENEIWALPAFHEQYEIVTVATGAPAPLEYFTFYCRKDTACGR